MIKPLLAKLISRQSLTRAEAAGLLGSLIQDEAITESQIAAVLTAYAIKEETVDELVGFAETMRKHCSPLRTRHSLFVDTAGTGGDGAMTFNISTAAAFVIAGAGVPVAKHGNRAASSRSGSADVLSALGVKIDAPVEIAARCLDEIGICFMFAPLYHPAMKRVFDVRRQLGFRTIFNLLGPLTNPAGAPRQVVGVAEERFVEMIAGALAALGCERAWVVHGESKLDEISICGRTRVAEVIGSDVNAFDLAPEDVGFPRCSINEIIGGSAEENAEIVTNVLSGKRTDGARRVVLLNAAAALVVTGRAQSLAGAIELATEAIDSGKALEKLEALIELSNYYR